MMLERIAGEDTGLVEQMVRRALDLATEGDTAYRLMQAADCLVREAQVEGTCPSTVEGDMAYAVFVKAYDCNDEGLCQSRGVELPEALEEDEFTVALVKATARLMRSLDDAMLRLMQAMREERVTE